MVSFKQPGPGIGGRALQRPKDALDHREGNAPVSNDLLQCLGGGGVRELVATPRVFQQVPTLGQLRWCRLRGIEHFKRGRVGKVLDDEPGLTVELNKGHEVGIRARNPAWNQQAWADC